MTTQAVLVQPLSPDRAVRLGLSARDYLIGEQITIGDAAADRLRRAGYLAPVGTTPTTSYVGYTLTVVTPAGTALPVRGRLKFTGASVTVTDDSANNQVIVNASGVDNTTAAVIRASGSTYPLRSTVTSDATRTVMWIGTVSPTIGGGYAVSGVDVWVQG